MSRTVPQPVLALLVLMAAPACGAAESGEQGAAPDTGRHGQANTGAAAPVRVPPPGLDSSPAPLASSTGLGLWNVANLEKRLDLQGMAPRKLPAPVRHPFLSVDGSAYQVGNAELQVFIYDDAAGVERDLARLDTITVAPRGEQVKWPTKPTLIRNNNLAAIFLGQNALQIERVQRALMAGQPPTP